MDVQTDCSDLIAKISEDEFDGIMDALGQGAVIIEGQEPNVSDHLIRHCFNALKEALRRRGFEGTLVAVGRAQPGQGYIYGFYDAELITPADAAAQVDRMYR